MAASKQLNPRLGWRLLLSAAAAAALSVAASPEAARAAAIPVNSAADTVADDGVCTLREAVIAADADFAVLGCRAGSGDDVITLGRATYALTIPPSGTEFDALSGSLDVVEPQGDELTIASYSGLAVIDASAIADRAITARSNLTLADVTVRGGDSSASVEGPGLGGAVATFGSEATLIVHRALLVGNRAAVAGGAISAASPLAVVDSTLSGNGVDSVAGGGGGAIDAQGDALVRRSTIAGNSVSSGDDLGSGGGLRFAGALTLDGSIVADNAADGGGPECAAAGGTATSGGFNVIEHAGAACAIALAASDVEADPGLGPLADNGGPTRTHAISAGSAAVDIGPPAVGCSGQSDQRGAPRGAAESGACDAGAYELAYCSFSPANVIGTTGTDLLTRPGLQISALGLGGDDLLFGGDGNDALCGGPGTDVLSGGGGADLLIGGPDVDIANYGSVSAPIAVALDDVANDGRSGEGDLVQTESVVGGSAGDLIAGDAAANGVQGGPGDDRIDGGAGKDSLLGQAGNDIVNGSAGDDQIRGGDGNDALFGLDGNDRLEGDDGNDTLDGGPGSDRLFGGGGKNRLVGGDGNDQLVGGPGKDVFKCGAGRDLALVSRKDKVARDCEKVVGGKKKGKGKKGKGKKGKGKGGKGKG